MQSLSPRRLLSRSDPPPLRRDPAPSRIAYRAQRLWLTPLFRSLLRTGVPVFVLCFAVGWLVTDEEINDTMVSRLIELRTSIEQRPEFMVQLMEIDGASDELVGDIREVMPIDFPISSFDLDLERMRDVIAQLDAIETVDIAIRPGGLLEVAVTERTPAVVWQTRDVLEILDAEGHRVAPIMARAAHAELPYIVGTGAEDHIPEALALVDVATPVHSRLIGLQRIGERRWDLVLDAGQRVLLPEEGAIRALELVMAADAAEDLLSRDIALVDLRLPHRPTLRLRDGAVEELRAMRGMVRENGSDG